MLMSRLFTGDDLLQRIADGAADRISQTRNRTAPGVRKVQTALLIWRPGVLPVHGADGDYGPETASAVVTFKTDELGVPPGQIVNDVGPRTVIRLDEIAVQAEEVAAAGFVAVTAAQATANDHAVLQATIADAGGRLLLGLGSHALVVGGSQDVQAALRPLIGKILAGLVTPQDTSLLPRLDPETAPLVSAWLAMLEPGFVLAKADPQRLGISFEVLDGCGQEVTV